jgi:hypothetical protein
MNHDDASARVATLSKMGTGHTRKSSLCVLLSSARSIALGNNTLTITTFLFSRPLLAPPPACTANFCVCFTGPPGDRGALHCHWNAIATQPLGLVPFSPRGHCRRYIVQFFTFTESESLPHTISDKCCFPPMATHDMLSTHI